jgi:hypothetical protein
MGIFQHFSNFPRGTPETILRLGGKSEENFRAINHFYQWVNSRDRQLDKPEMFDEAIKRILPNPHKLTMVFFPTITDCAQNCSQEYFVISERKCLLAIIKIRNVS